MSKVMSSKQPVCLFVFFQTDSNWCVFPIRCGKGHADDSGSLSENFVTE